MSSSTLPLTYGLDIGKEADPYVVEPLESPVEAPVPVEEPDYEEVPA